MEKMKGQLISLTSVTFGVASNETAPMEMKEAAVSHFYTHLYLAAHFLSLPSSPENWNKISSLCGYALIFVVRFTKGKLLALKRKNAGEWSGG